MEVSTFSWKKVFHLILPILFAVEMFLAAYMIPDYPRAGYNVLLAIVFLIMYLITSFDLGIYSNSLTNQQINIELPTKIMNELIRIKSIEYANWAEENRRILGLSDENLYDYYKKNIDTSLNS